MRLVSSNQVDVKFIFCPSPVTIDKRAEWGNAADNLQVANNGAFLKMDTDYTVSHLVQSKKDFSAPVGWIPGSGPGLYTKEPIWLGNEVNTGDTISLNTLDGSITYTAKEPSVVCYNSNADGMPNEADVWVQTWRAVTKNYNV